VKPRAIAQPSVISQFRGNLSGNEKSDRGTTRQRRWQDGFRKFGFPKDRYQTEIESWRELGCKGLLAFRHLAFGFSFTCLSDIRST